VSSGYARLETKRPEPLLPGRACPPVHTDLGADLPPGDRLGAGGRTRDVPDPGGASWYNRRIYAARRSADLAGADGRYAFRSLQRDRRRPIDEGESSRADLFVVSCAQRSAPAMAGSADLMSRRAYFSACCSRAPPGTGTGLCDLRASVVKSPGGSGRSAARVDRRARCAEESNGGVGTAQLLILRQAGGPELRCGRRKYLQQLGRDEHLVRASR
jgi:hypothetical protein